MNTTPMILQPSDRHEIGSAGGKALALWKLREEGLPIPQWFVITPAAFREGKLCEEATQLIRDNLTSLGLIDKPLAVRSSSVEEDAASSSFAGQFESFLGVTANQLEDAAVKVWNSGYADRVDAYKDARGEEKDFQPLAVIVQELIASEVAGVAFSVDPVSVNWDNALVSAVMGLGSTLVDGESDADMYTIDRSDRELSRDIAHKSKARRLVSAHGFQVIDQELSNLAAEQACLSQEQAQDIARLARQCEAYFGRPQDIEWAIAKGELYLLQSRPITTLQNLADARGKLYIWDNSNIAESYSGITLPLTFSFARYIYTEVYRQFCLLLNVPSKRIAQHRALFGQMLGSIRGRVYYNLLSWYKVLALLPGYSLNRGFMEQMMGVKESLSKEAQREVDVVKGNGKFIDGINLSRSLIGLLWKHWTIERDVRRFYRRLDQALGRLPKPIESMRLEELADHFHDLERDLLTSWDAPLVNDFIAMIFFGALKRLCEKWVGDESDSLHNDLICEMGNIISAEPAKRIRKMATIAAKDDSLCELLRSGRIGEIRKAIERSIELKKEIDSYFEKFGDRCLDELKLESLALVDDPLLLYRSIGELAVRQSSDEVVKGPPAKDTRQGDAEARVFGALKGAPIKKALFRYVLKHARRRVSGRENLRFERTRLFGRIRRTFLEMGKRLSAFNVLDDPRDIFYLEIYEIIGYIEGSGPTANLKALVELRRQEYDGYANERGPGDRFETKGAVPIGNRYQSGPRAETVQESGSDLQGIGCCPGVVRGVARVVTNPQDAQLKRGEILVAKQTDPGWIMLFPLASGLLVERGSLLSHSAIVSRELGLPAVVSICGLMDTLKTGDEIELDGSRGIVRILKRVEDTDDAIE
ncbi:PEP-utilizing enzyme [Opitutaceae bacterium]|nr:PEP-utilizing enzyme [Opitutaceae bacterium]